MRKPLILLAGAGGHARACLDVIEQEGRYSVAGFVGLPEEIGTRILGYPVLGTDADLASMFREFSVALVTVGQIKTPELRMRLYDVMQKSGWLLPVIVSPRAYVSPHARLGAGTIVMHGAVVNAAAEVGRNCIVNSHALIEHDAVVGDHCHVATGAVLNSGVCVGRGSFIGSGTVVRQRLKIGERCVIGMAQRVLIDCESGMQLPQLRSPA